MEKEEMKQNSRSYTKNKSFSFQRSRRPHRVQNETFLQRHLHVRTTEELFFDYSEIEFMQQKLQGGFEQKLRPQQLHEAFTLPGEILNKPHVIKTEECRRKANDHTRGVF